MEIRSVLSAQTALLVVLWSGIGGFVLLHTVLIFVEGGEPTQALFRFVWSGGLVLTIVLSSYLLFGDANTRESRE